MKKSFIIVSSVFWSMSIADAQVPNTAFFSKNFTPAAFSFTNQTEVEVNTVIVSNSVALPGNGTRSVSAVCSGCTLERNANGTWAASIAGFKRGDTIRIRLTSSGSSNTTVTASVTVGKVASSVWSVTTVSYTYSWYQSGWGACPLNSWTYSSTGGCSPSCGPGTQWVSYVCNASWNTQTQTVYCRRSDSVQVADAFCSGAGTKPDSSQSCYQTSCSGVDPSYSSGCNNGACVTCNSQSITVPTGSGGNNCTDTLPAYTGPSGGQVWSYRANHYGCQGGACTVGGCGDTPYYGTVSGGVYGTCYDYCAVRADCVGGSWTNYGYTW